MSEGEVGRQVSVAAFWSYAGAIVERIVRFAVFVLIARLVTPAEFGVVTLAALVAGLLQDLIDAGIGQALLRQTQPDDLTFDSAFWAMTGLGLAATLLLFAVASAGAGLFDNAAVPRVLQVLALLPLLNTAGAIHSARLQRELGFKALSLRLVGASLLSGVAGVALAFVGWGVWALVARALLAAGIQTALLWLFCAWRPRLRFSGAALRPLLPDSVRLMASSLLNQLNSRGFDLVAGVVLGAIALATLRIAGQTVMLLIELTAGPITAVAFAILSRNRDDPVLARATFVMLARTSALLLFPAFFGLAAVSDTLFPLMFGGQWGGAARLMPLLCLLALPVYCQLMLIAALFAAGRTDRILHWQMAQGVATILTVVMGAPFGIWGIATATVAHLYLLLPLGAWWLRRDGGVPVVLLVSAMVPSLAAAAAMGAVVLAAQAMLAARLQGWALLAPLIGTGVATSAALLPLVAPDLLREGWRQARARLGR